MIDQITQIMSGIKELELQQHHLRNALEMMNRAYETAYQKGYSDAMGWKTQNHLEHLPTKKEWVGLTDEEMADFTLFHAVVDEECVRAIEAKLKEKNNG